MNQNLYFVRISIKLMEAVYFTQDMEAFILLTGLYAKNTKIVFALLPVSCMHREALNHSCAA